MKISFEFQGDTYYVAHSMYNVHLCTKNNTNKLKAFGINKDGMPVALEVEDEVLNMLQTSHDIIGVGLASINEMNKW